MKKVHTGADEAPAAAAVQDVGEEDTDVNGDEEELYHKREPEPPPAQQGYRMPAEWEPHKQVWMGWPLRPDNWRNQAGPAQDAFAAVAEAILEFEPVTICAPSIPEMHKAAARLPTTIEVIFISQNDSWFRDCGPTFLVRDSPDGKRELAGVDWRFNAWGGLKGGLYKNWRDDNLVAGRILRQENVRRFKCHAVMEGGSFHVDGEGTVLTTEQCLLNPNRNPELSKEQIERVLLDHLGASKVLWLPKGLYGDEDTNGHVDNMACFARPGVVLLSWTDDASDPQHAISQEALAWLEGQTDGKGRPLHVIKLPVPPPLCYSEEEVAGLTKVEGSVPRKVGERLAASYVNFYLPNGGVIVPQFGGAAAEADARALKILAEVFPERKVVGVATREVLLGGGNIHCITQQEPALFLP